MADASEIKSSLLSYQLKDADKAIDQQLKAKDEKPTELEGPEKEEAVAYFKDKISKKELSIEQIEEAKFIKVGDADAKAELLKILNGEAEEEDTGPTLKMRSSGRAGVNFDVRGGTGDIKMNAYGVTASAGGDAAIVGPFGLGGSLDLGVRTQGTAKYLTIGNEKRDTGTDLGFLIGGRGRASLQIGRCHRIFLEGGAGIHFFSSKEFIDPYTKTADINDKGETGYAARPVDGGTQLIGSVAGGWAWKIAGPLGLEAKLAFDANKTFSDGLDSLSFNNFGVSVGPMIATEGFCTEEVKAELPTVKAEDITAPKEISPDDKDIEVTLKNLPEGTLTVGMPKLEKDKDGNIQDNGQTLELITADGKTVKEIKVEKGADGKVKDVTFKVKLPADLKLEAGKDLTLKARLVGADKKDVITIPDLVFKVAEKKETALSKIIKLGDVEISTIDEGFVYVGASSEEDRKVLTFEIKKGDKAGFNYIIDPKNDGKEKWERRSFDRSEGRTKINILFPEDMMKTAGAHTIKIKFDGDSTVHTHQARVVERVRATIPLPSKLESVTFNTALVEAGNPAYSKRTTVKPTSTIKAPDGTTFTEVTAEVTAPGATTSYVIQVGDVSGSKEVPLYAPEGKINPPPAGKGTVKGATLGEYKVVFKSQGRMIYESKFIVNNAAVAGTPRRPAPARRGGSRL